MEPEIKLRREADLFFFTLTLTHSVCSLLRFLMEKGSAGVRVLILMGVFCGPEQKKLIMRRHGVRDGLQLISLQDICRSVLKYRWLAKLTSVLHVNCPLLEAR